MAAAPFALNNPILDEIDRAHAQLSPAAQQAVAMARNMGGGPGITPEPQAAPSPGIAMPSESPVPGIPRGTSAPAASPAPAISAPAPAVNPIAAAHKTELARLTGAGPDPNQGKSGIDQIHSPWARIPLQIASAVGGGLFPGIAMGIPGTQLHHNLEVHAARNAVAGDEEQANGEAKRKLEAAQTANQESIPELNKTKADLATAKEHEVETSHRNTEEINRTKSEGQRQVRDAQVDARLAEHGMKRDPETGEIVPQKYEEMSEPLQAIHDLKAAQSEQAQATAAFRKAQSENAPQAAKLAQQRLDSAAAAHNIALRRLGLSEKQYEMRAHGTEGGVALPGSITNEDNNPVGTAFQQNVRPTGQERNKADLATSAHEQLQDMKSIVAKRQDIFGPLAGRKTDFNVWLGSQDPDAQRFRAARTIAGDHLAGVFGGRSEAALKALDDAIGHFKDNPAAIQSGLDQLDKANRIFVERGTVHTQGGTPRGEQGGGVPKPGETFNGHKVLKVEKIQ